MVAPNEDSATGKSADPRSAAQSGAVMIRYWAGAEAAAGCASERASAGVVAEVLDQAYQRHPALAPVLRMASILVDGVRAEPGEMVPAGATIEVLPPFAGG